MRHVGVPVAAAAVVAPTDAGGGGDVVGDVAAVGRATARDGKYETVVATVLVTAAAAAQRHLDRQTRRSPSFCQFPPAAGAGAVQRQHDHVEARPGHDTYVVAQRTRWFHVAVVAATPRPHRSAAGDIQRTTARQPVTLTT